ncbi:hypothetical protein PVAG01_09148 [Phlyctema vagabunda]|uniref:Uncharacterized protein n=1 Tax=Phlyctema vagabunda TaxID=108571 RepID=A0ABR4P6Y2_9HELO
MGRRRNFDIDQSNIISGSRRSRASLRIASPVEHVQHGEAVDQEPIHTKPPEKEHETNPTKRDVREHADAHVQHVQQVHTTFPASQPNPAIPLDQGTKTSEQHLLNMKASSVQFPAANREAPKSQAILHTRTVLGDIPLSPLASEERSVRDGSPLLHTNLSSVSECVTQNQTHSSYISSYKSPYEASQLGLKHGEHTPLSRPLLPITPVSLMHRDFMSRPHGAYSTILSPGHEMEYSMLSSPIAGAHVGMLNTISHQDDSKYISSTDYLLLTFQLFHFLIWSIRSSSHTKQAVCSFHKQLLQGQSWANLLWSPTFEYPYQGIEEISYCHPLNTSIRTKGHLY